MTPKRKCILPLACLVSILLLSQGVLIFVSANTGSGSAGILRYEINDVFFGSLKQQVLVENPTFHRVAGGTLHVPLIGNQTSRHYAVVDNVSSSLGSPKILTDSSENTYAYWDNVVIEPLQKMTVEVNYELVSFGVRYVTNFSQVFDFNKTSDLYLKYTQPEDLVESDDPLVVSKARNVVGDEQNAEKKVSKLYSFVIGYLRYEVQTDERGALWALENKIGDCSEFSYLFVALCRAVGIPARIETGFAFHFADEVVQDGHMWAEYYLENCGWIPVDPTWKLFSETDGRHFASMQGIPEHVPYCNFLFDYAHGPPRGDLNENQSVSLSPLSAEFGNDNTFENARKAIDDLTMARLIILVEKTFGASVVFPSQLNEIDESFLESQIHMQSAIENWIGKPQEAQQESAEALETATLVLQKSEALIAYIAATLAGISILAMLLIIALLKRKRRIKERGHS